MKKVLGFYKKDECSSCYKMGKTLGSGSFATVKNAISKEDGSEWAIKCIAKSSLGPEDEEALKVEVAILEKVEHPNIVSLKQVFDCPKTFYMVMEKMTGGELFDRIVAKEKYTEKEAAEVVVKIATALKYCHDMGIVHRDLKPENLLYASEAEDAEIKIADFGLAKILSEDSMMSTACGTPGYVAPEILEGRTYTDKVDMWSLGVITYILLCGFPPFYDENNAALFAAIKAGSFEYHSPYWDDVSSGAKDLIDNLLVVNAETRLSAEQVLKHPWVAAQGPETGAGDLSLARTEMKKFNARRKFRAGIAMAKAITAFGDAAKLAHKERMMAAAKAAKEAQSADKPPEAAGPATGSGSGAGAGTA